MGTNALEEDTYRYLVFGYKDFPVIASEVFKSRILCEQKADEWIANPSRKGITVEVVKVL